MTKKMLDEIRKDFVSYESSDEENEDQRGLGLGLSLCK